MAGAMQLHDPISLWIGELKDGQSEAAAKLWKRYRLPLLAIARRKIAKYNSAYYDEEDATQSAFRSLCMGLRNGRFPDISDGDSLWRLMLVITSRKISAQQRYQHRQQRDVKRSVQESTFSKSESNAGMDSLPASTAAPDFAAQFDEICEELFTGLDAGELRTVGLLKVQGYTDSEIATKMNCSRRTVQRRLDTIRQNWKESVEYSEAN